MLTSAWWSIKYKATNDLTIATGFRPTFLISLCYGVNSGALTFELNRLPCCWPQKLCCQLLLWAGITFSLGKDTEWMARLQEFPATVCSRSNGKHYRRLHDCENSERTAKTKRDVWKEFVILAVKTFLLSLMFSQVHWSFLKKGCLLISSTPLRPSRTSLRGSWRTYEVTIRGLT